MKYLILLFLVLISSFSSYAAIERKELKCSRAGTDIILVNGISWGPKTVKYITKTLLEPSIPKSYIDNKSPAGSFVDYKFSYNNSNGFLRDMLESAAQKISQNFNISTNNAFIAAYYFTYKGVVTTDFIESIFNAKGVTFSSISTYLISYFSPNTLDKMVQDSFNTNATDTIKLKSSISDTLLSGKKLILITESQGNFFGKQAISDFLNGENLNFGGKTGQINDYLGTIGQVQIAPPTGSLLPKNKVVLNDRDIINLVFF